MKFSKKPTTLDEQVELLKSRGVIIDSVNAASILESVNYYRFCGYGLYFEEYDQGNNRLNRFKKGTTFSQIHALYLWDECLKQLLQKYLGIFEILFRSVLNYSLVTDSQDPFWYIRKDLKIIASKMKAPPDNIASWVRSLVILRNRCAHHGRLWGYRFKIKPSLTPKMRRMGMDNGSIGALIYILYDLLSTVKISQNAMALEFNKLMQECLQDCLGALGLSHDFRLLQEMKG